jgi:hypothetical protein
MLITRGSEYWPAAFVHIHDLVDPIEVGDRVLDGVRAAVAALRLHSVT